MKKVIVFLSLAVLVSCGSSRHLHQNENITTTAELQRDGSSFDKAIIITETSDLAGTTAEYTWLKKYYPGYKMIKQSLVNHDKKPFDILNIRTKEGTEKDIYFDISSSYGKGF